MTITPVLLSTNTTDNSATILVDGKRWEYIFASPDTLRRLDFLMRRWPLRGLNFAKRRAIVATTVQLH